MEEARAKCPNCGSSFPAGATFCPECGYVVPISAPVAPPPAVERIVVPTPQPSVVYVQPPVEAPRETNWGPWVAIAVVILLVVGGFALWSGGFLGGGGAAAPPPTTVTIDNSPRMSSETPPQSQQPAATPASVPPAPPAATPPAATPPPAAAPPSKTPAIDIVSVKGQALETGDVEWKYGYTMVLRNNTDQAVTGTYRIQFLDEQGYPVDDAVMKDLVVPANTKISFDGVSMIKAPLAQRIRTLRAELR